MINLKKNVNRKSEREVEKRHNFIDNLSALFDITSREQTLKVKTSKVSKINLNEDQMNVNDSDEYMENDNSNSESDEEYCPLPIKKKKSSHKLNFEFCGSLDRTKTTNRQTFHLIAPVMQDPPSYSTISRKYFVMKQ